MAIYLALWIAALPAQAEMIGSLENLRSAFEQGGGNGKSLSQLQCFLRKHQTKTFRTKMLGGELKDRCKGERIRWQNENAAVIVDFTQNSSRPRFYLFDLHTNTVHFLHTAHGRFGNTSPTNPILTDEPKRNSVLQVKHFSNEVGSNASAGGFYLTGAEYQGNYGRSLVLHGLEEGFNHNSCERMTVIHKSSAITETATNSMSSGCPMVAETRIEQVINTLGEGALTYIFTPAEAKLSASTCGRNLLE